MASLAAAKNNQSKEAELSSQVSVYSKYKLANIKSDSRSINPRDAQESREFEGSIIWNNKTFKEAVKPFLGKGIKSFFTTEQEHGYGRNTNNSSSEVNSNEEPSDSGSENTIGIYCNSDIPLDYAYDAFKGADVILVSRDRTSDGKLGSYRGFVCLKLGKNARGETDKDSVYIDLICNAKGYRSSAKRQGKENASGKLLLNAVKDFARNAGYPKVALKALETVIPYYYKFGWRFVESCDAAERDWTKDNVSALKKVLFLPDSDSTKEEKVTAELQKFKRYLPGLTEETALRTVMYSDDDDFDDMVDADTVRAHVANLRESGYPMLFCFSWYEGGKQGGGRRRRRKRRTRKKKIKKSRKTRRKRHRKKRTRKRRGGTRGYLNSRSTRRARERGVNIMPPIREPRVWKIKENKRTGNNLMRNHIKHGVAKTRK